MCIRDRDSIASQRQVLDQIADLGSYQFIRAEWRTFEFEEMKRRQRALGNSNKHTINEMSNDHADSQLVKLVASCEAWRVWKDENPISYQL